jgi:hypothetical protein
MSLPQPFSQRHELCDGGYTAVAAIGFDDGVERVCTRLFTALR